MIPWLIRDHPLSALAWLGVTAGARVSVGFTIVSYNQAYDLQKPFMYATIAVGLAAAAEAHGGMCAVQSPNASVLGG